ncbi:MAG: response regulator [Treponema sp.]|jgi:signal transduction histidine kinase/ActR/RegA family two-component response regulator|nr:response regulator [Treponema sp.]
MSTRLKVFLIITIIILAITASSVLISISSAQSQILQTLKDNMQSLVSLANENISYEMELLKSDAVAVAQTLIGHPVHEMQQLLVEQIAAYPNFAAVAIINEKGNALASYSERAAPPPDNAEMAKYREMALAGQKVITSTYKDDEGKLVFYVFAPMDDYGYMTNPAVIGVTVSGLYFNNIVNRLMMWNTGRITIVDNKGKIIADEHDEWVEEQFNFVDLAADNSRYSDFARVIERMISKDDGNVGTARYRLKGMEGGNLDNVVAFMPIASPERWAISVSTAIADSAYYTVMGMIGVSGLIFLVLGMVAAALASGFIAKPFELLKAATKAKTAFIANMSHDLRTPLNAIISLSQLVRTRKELPDVVRNHQKRIYESGMTILGVVNDLLDISNIEAGKFGVISSEYDLPDFIMSTANSNLRHIGSRQVAISIIPDDKLPARLNGDSLRIRQVFNNLLRNAITHSKTGTIEWKIWTEKGEGDTVWLASSILDPGQEIGYEEVDKLFLDYSSLDTQKKRSSEGTGLGLSLTKKIIDIMKGSIAVQNAFGKGTLFTVRLPHKYVSDEVISAEYVKKLKTFDSSGNRKQDDLSNMQRVHLPDAHVLVVDDVETNLDVAKGMLEPYGMKVDCVISGKEAIELVRRGEPRYSAILMNRWMPEMDGIEAVRIIRNDIEGDYAKTVPIIALTVNAVIGNNSFFTKAGFQEVLSKPISVSRLDEIVNQWIGGK